MTLRKSRTRNTRATDYGMYFLADTSANYLLSSEYGPVPAELEARILPANRSWPQPTSIPPPDEEGRLRDEVACPLRVPGGK